MKLGKTAAVLGILLLGGLTPEGFRAQENAGTIVLADFSEFPKGWKFSSDTIEVREIYRALPGETGTTLRAEGKDKPYRIFKKISWDSAAYPFLEWKWRVTRWPKNPDAKIYFYVSLDKDLFGIPTMIKYVWSQKQEAGSVKKGGFFRPTEMVLQGGSAGSEAWTGQTINARKDFESIIGREPREKAYGIGILVDPGVEAEFGEIIAKGKQ